MRSPTLLGTVQDVKGATVSIVLDDTTISGLSLVDGYAYRVGQVGSFVRIPLGFDQLFGIVSEVGVGAVPENVAERMPFGNRWLRIQLVGQSEGASEFKRGISQYPTIGDLVHLVTEDDLGELFGSLHAPHHSRIGRLASAESIPARVDLNRLVNRHSAVFGSTGSGKSTTVASLIHSATGEAYPAARVILVDPHGEYATAFRGKGLVLTVNADSKKDERELYIPYWAASFDEFVSIAFGTLDDTTRAAVMDKVLELKRESVESGRFGGVDVDTLSVDSPIPFSVHRLWWEMYTRVIATHTAQGANQSVDTWALRKNDEGEIVQPGDAATVTAPMFEGNTQEQGATKIYLAFGVIYQRKPFETLASRLRDARFRFLFNPGPWDCVTECPPSSDLGILLADWLGAERPVTVFDLSSTPSAIASEVVGLLLRIVYDAVLWGRDTHEGGRHRPLLIVLEEAHAYMGRSGRMGAATYAVQRIAKEGRKYGVGLMLVSQRPSEIDATVLSQCGTFIAMRLTNSEDRSCITSAAPDNLEGLFAMLPSLRTGEAIIVGEAVPLPIRALIEPTSKELRPDGHDPWACRDESEPGGWNKPRGEENYDNIVLRWRAQRHLPTSTTP